MERLRVYYLDNAAKTPAGDTKVMTTEMFDAVLATSAALRRSTSMPAASRAGVPSLWSCPRPTSLTAANKRIANILRKRSEGSVWVLGGSGLDSKALSGSQPLDSSCSMDA